jgi:hypothetical protein
VSRTLVAEFVEAEALVRTAQHAGATRYRLIDAFTPFPIEGFDHLVGATSTRLRVIMFIGGMSVAALAYGIEAYSAVLGYPFNSGGRPLNSWPAFMLFPFAIGIFGAALTGLIAMLIKMGLPRLHHPLFEIDGFERATQDRFLLALEGPPDVERRVEAAAWLRQEGAVNVWDLET